jgi:hypothetical protein
VDIAEQVCLNDSDGRVIDEIESRAAAYGWDTLDQPIFR